MKATNLILLAALLSVAMYAEPLKTAPPDLIQLKDADLTAARPLVLARAGVYVCRNGFDMYVQTAQTNNAIVKVPPLSHARLIETEKDKIYVICVAIEK